jgi:hypothetical protein
MLASWRLVFHQTLKEIATIKIRLVATITLKKREVRLSMEGIRILFKRLLSGLDLYIPIQP